MAYLDTQQLAASLPDIIPPLTIVMNDSHREVRNSATRSLQRFWDVISTPDVTNWALLKRSQKFSQGWVPLALKKLFQRYYKMSHLLKLQSVKGLCLFSSSCQLALATALLFFFQAEDGIRDADVTGVQTCALPISDSQRASGERIPRLRRRCPSGKPQPCGRQTTSKPEDVCRGNRRCWSMCGLVRT